MDTRRTGAGTVGAVIAAANPEHQVHVVDTPSDIPASFSGELDEGNWDKFAKLFEPVFASLHEDVRLTGLHGNSLGANIVANIPRARILPNTPDVISLHDAPRAQPDRNPVAFGLATGLRDNLVKYPNAPEEEVLKTLDIGVPNTGMFEAAKLAKKQWPLIRAMAQTGLENELHESIAMTMFTDFYIFHGERNVGIPIEHTTAMVKSLHYRSTYARDRLAYYTGDGGHYFTGQAARMARMIHWVNRQKSFYA